MALCGRSAKRPGRRERSGSRTFWLRCRRGGGRREDVDGPDPDVPLHGAHAAALDPRPLAAGVRLHEVRAAGAGV